MGKAGRHDIELLIFDLGGVILNIDYRFTQEAFEKLGVTDIDQMYSQASQIDLFDDLEKGFIEPSVFRSGIRDLIGVEVGDEEIDLAWNALLQDLPSHRLEFIKTLRGGRKTCLLSNTNEIHIKCFEEAMSANGQTERFNGCFDHIYYSSRIGMRKPDAEVFEKVMSDFGVPAYSCLFIDDSEQHIHAARELGIQVLHLEKEKEIAHELAYLIS